MFSNFIDIRFIEKNACLNVLYWNKGGWNDLLPVSLQSLTKTGLIQRLFSFYCTNTFTNVPILCDLQLIKPNWIELHWITVTGNSLFFLLFIFLWIMCFLVIFKLLERCSIFRTMLICWIHPNKRGNGCCCFFLHLSCISH